jgi:type IX secretion system PorP/SprF family membrane protein
MRKLIVVSIFFLLYAVDSRSQNYSLNSNYYLNPYLYNPAEAATSFAQFQVNYRQQWMGFNGAPKTATASFTTLLNDSRAGVGVKASCFSRGILKTADFLISYAYAIPFNFNNYLYLGISGGAISNDIDLTNVDTTDPALRNYLGGNLQPVGNFGALFRSQGGINFGVILPQLFTPKFTATEHFENRNTSPTDEVIFTTYYRRKVDSKFPSRKRNGRRHTGKAEEMIAPLEFYALYRLSKHGHAQAEGIVKLNFNDNGWVAGGYRQDFGFIGSFGLKLSTNVMVSYTYEPGARMGVDYSPNSHEIQLGFRVGKMKTFKKVAPALQSTLKGKRPEHHIARFQEPSENADAVAPKTDSKTYYVVIRGFNDFTGADNFKSKLMSQKYNAEVFYYDKEKRFYVYVYSSDRSNQAYHEARQLRNFTKLKEARVLTVDLKGAKKAQLP